MHALTRGDVGAAFGHNPLVVVLLPVAVAGLAAWLSAAFIRRPLPVVPAPRVVGTVAVLLLAAYWVGRNLS